MARPPARGGRAPDPAPLPDRSPGARGRGRAGPRGAPAPRGGRRARSRRAPRGHQGGPHRRATRALPAPPGRGGPPPAAPPPAPTPRVALGDAWASAVDGTGGRGLWLTLAGPYGERTLLAAVLSDETGLIDFSSGAIPKKRVEERLHALRAESPLPWVAVPARWAWATLVAAAERATRRGRPPCPRTSASGSSGSAPRRPSRRRSTRGCRPRPPRTRPSSSGPRRSSPSPS